MTSWPSVPLCEVGSVITGATPKTSQSNFYGGEIPFVTPAELDVSTPIMSTPRTLTEAGASQVRLIPPGTIMVCCIGSLGKVGMAGRALATNQQINSVIFDPTRVWPRYGYHACRLLRPKLVAMAPATTVAIVSKSKFEALHIPLPPLDEQRRIAAILDAADSLRAKRRAALAKLDQLAQSIFIEMFGDPIENSHALPISTLADLIDPARPLTYGILMPGPDEPDGILYVRVVDMKNGGIDASSMRRTTAKIASQYRRSQLKPGDLLMSIRGHVGRMAIVPASLNGANITQDTARIALQHIDTVYVQECLRTAAAQRWMAKRTKGAAVKGINLGDLREMPIPIPSSDAQLKFSQRIQIVEHIRKNATRHILDLETLFASLQHSAFRGAL